MGQFNNALEGTPKALLNCPIAINPCELLSHFTTPAIGFGINFVRRLLNIVVPLFFDWFDDLLWRLFCAEWVFLIIYYFSDGSLESIIKYSFGLFFGCVVTPLFNQVVASKK